MYVFYLIFVTKASNHYVAMNRVISYVMLASMFIFCLSACDSKKEQVETTSEGYPVHIPFATALESERDLRLSDVADSVRFIPLETTDASLMNRVATGNILKSSKYWFVPSYRELFQFTDEGKFVRTIGSRGSGPGEYISVLCADIDESLGHVYVLSPTQKSMYMIWKQEHISIHAKVQVLHHGPS